MLPGGLSRGAKSFEPVTLWLGAVYTLAFDLSAPACTPSTLCAFATIAAAARTPETSEAATTAMTIVLMSRVSPWASHRLVPGRFVVP